MGVVRLRVVVLRGVPLRLFLHLQQILHLLHALNVLLRRLQLLHALSVQLRRLHLLHALSVLLRRLQLLLVLRVLLLRRLLLLHELLLQLLLHELLLLLLWLSLWLRLWLQLRLRLLLLLAAGSRCCCCSGCCSYAVGCCWPLGAGAAVAPVVALLPLFLAAASNCQLLKLLRPLLLVVAGCSLVALVHHTMAMHAMQLATICEATCEAASCKQHAYQHDHHTTI